MNEVVTLDIKVSHLEPNNCYPNSTEVYKLKINDKEDSFSFKSHDRINTREEIKKQIIKKLEEMF